MYNLFIWRNTMKKLAIFDIDFTITKKETFIQLFIYSIKKDIKNIKYIPRAIYSGVMYGLGFFDLLQVSFILKNFMQ